MQQTSFTSTTADEEYVYAGEEYVYAGFPGCRGSVDGAHVPGMDSNLVRVQTMSAKRMLSGVIGEFIANPIAN